MEITRDEIRKLATRLHIAATDIWGGITPEDNLVELLKAASDVLTTPAWFSANELRLAADAMDILDYHTADGWTLRQRLDAFWETGPLIKNAGSFAAYLHELPRVGVQ